MRDFWGDERALRQIFSNILSNAIKFTEIGGRIAVVFERTSDDGLEIFVRDNGRGMSPEGMEAALQLFGQVRESGDTMRGTGLGLPLAKSFVELHGGILSLESEVGIGTAVRLSFPAARLKTR
ncbi:MAG: ATP-binding protein [Alphaproteobacteria bacterium]|nr:ATP-binding protein [Alphaproteobacteria bacterium]